MEMTLSEGEKLKQVGIKKEKGYLYFIDKEGDISRAKASSGIIKGGSAEKILEVHIQKEPGYLYFVDKDGDVSFAKLRRGGTKKMVIKSFSNISAQNLYKAANNAKVDIDKAITKEELIIVFKKHVPCVGYKSLARMLIGHSPEESVRKWAEKIK